jgi:hypothetical protein
MRFELRRSIKHSPLPSQKKFHDSKARFKGFSGPIGSGKSQALCQEAIRLTYQNPGCTGLIGAPTYPMLKDATLASLMECLYESEIPFELYKAENVIVMGDTGSKILLRAVDDFERLRGTNLAWFGVDELTYAPEGAWSRLEGRLRDPKAKRLCGFAVWTPKGFDWVYRRFIQNPASGFEAIMAAPYENRYLLKQAPDFYERLKSSYDENFFRQEVLGDYLNAAGNLVYQAFVRMANVREMSVDPALPVCWAVDFNVDPMCSVVAQGSGGEFSRVGRNCVASSLHRAGVPGVRETLRVTGFGRDCLRRRFRLCHEDIGFFRLRCDSRVLQVAGREGDLPGSERQSAGTRARERRQCDVAKRGRGHPFVRGPEMQRADRRFRAGLIPRRFDSDR